MSYPHGLSERGRRIAALEARVEQLREALRDLRELTFPGGLASSSIYNQRTRDILARVNELLQ